MTDLNLIYSIFELANGPLREQMLREFEAAKRIPPAVGRILIFANAVLPGGISRLANDVERHEVHDLLIQLENEDPFREPSIVAWLKRSGSTYPGTSAYFISLEMVRRLAIDFLQNEYR